MTGNVVLTSAGDLPAKKIVHAVGPVHEQYKPKVSELLVISCIINILELAKDQDMVSVSIPAISIGEYFGYPLEDCAYTMLTFLIKWAA
jgi:O-acetyl-ADP-ribose deacetylase